MLAILINNSKIVIALTGEYTFKNLKTKRFNKVSGYLKTISTFYVMPKTKKNIRMKKEFPNRSAAISILL